ncbi:MAG TPA: hypothetical protein VN642_02380, partial [Dongiaceae bacterium]|nr:hypothetical protein [Dongiaceae bacterium]
GGLACTSKHVEFGFSQDCKYGGPGKDNFFGLSLGVSDITVRDACDARDIRGESDGVVFSGFRGIYNGGFAIDWSGGVASLTTSVALGAPLIGSKKSITAPNVYKILGLEGGIGVVRHCMTAILKAGLEGEILDLGI